MTAAAKIALGTLFLVCLGGRYHASQAWTGDVQIVDDFLMDEDEIQALMSARANPEGVGFAPVSDAFVGRVLATQTQRQDGQTAGEVRGGGGSCDNKDRVVEGTASATRILTRRIPPGETPLHQDRRWDEARTLVEDPVGFIFLNDNPDASFVMYGGAGAEIGGTPTHHREPSLTVHPKRGRLLVFDGRIPHQTIVQSGLVHLAGPFLMKGTMDYVGISDDAPVDDVPQTEAPAPKKKKGGKKKGGTRG